MPKLFPTSLVGSYPQPDWLVDHKVLKSQTVPRVRLTQMWRVAEPYLEQAQDDATLIAIRAQEEAEAEISREHRPATVGGFECGAVVKANELQSGYIRPIAFYGSVAMGVASRASLMKAGSITTDEAELGRWFTRGADRKSCFR